MHSLSQTTGDLKRTGVAVMPPVAFWSLRLVETEEQVLGAPGGVAAAVLSQYLGSLRLCDRRRGDGLRREPRQHAGRSPRGGRAGP